MPSTATEPLSGRDRALLRAVAAGRAELIGGCEPDLLIDGLCCCDQYAAHRLARAGLIRPAAPAAIGQRVPAELTAAGAAALSRIAPSEPDAHPPGECWPRRRPPAGPHEWPVARDRAPVPPGSGLPPAPGVS